MGAVEGVAVADVAGQVGKDDFVAEAVGLPEPELDALGEAYGAADQPGAGRPGGELAL